MIGLERMARENGAAILRDARAGRLAQATNDDYKVGIRDLERRVEA